MGNMVVNGGMLLMVLGLLVICKMFNRIGPVETPQGMRRLGWAIIALGFAVALSQSEPTTRQASAASEQTGQESR